MRQLRQRYATDCFPTCIAMISGIAHKQALKLVHPRHIKGGNYTTTLRQGVIALTKLGFSPNIKKSTIKNFCQLKKPAIISISWKTYPGNHVVVWDSANKKIYDPFYKHALPYSLYLKNMRWYLEI